MTITTISLALTLPILAILVYCLLNALDRIHARLELIQIRQDRQKADLKRIEDAIKQLQNQAPINRPNALQEWLVAINNYARETVEIEVSPRLFDQILIDYREVDPYLDLYRPSMSGKIILHNVEITRRLK